MSELSLAERLFPSMPTEASNKAAEASKSAEPVVGRSTTNTSYGDTDFQYVQAMQKHSLIEEQKAPTTEAQPATQQQPQAPQPYETLSPAFYKDEVQKLAGDADLTADPLSSSFIVAARENGMAPEQAHQLMGWYEQQREAENARNVEAVQALDGHEGMIANARALIKAHGDKDTMAWLEQGVGNHPELIKLLNRVQKTIATLRGNTFPRL